jgi:probable F420-dependent oxidoreductase
VRLGFTTMNTPDDLRPDVLGKLLEDRGYDSLWIGEHSHIPVSRRTPYPTGGELPPQYLTMMDPFVSLTMAAGATTELLVATGVALALEHDVFDLAKTVATLDVLSGGRVLFGVGCGWNEEELANHRPDISWGLRYQALAECVTALRSLWTDDESEFHGRFFNFDRVWSRPKPMQRPHPPVVCGMSGRLGTTHAVEWADEWNPMDLALGNVPKKVGLFRAAAAAAGRGDIPITITTFGDPTFETLELYKSLGVYRVVVGASREGWDDPSGTVPFIDRYAAAIPALAD